MNSTKLNFEHLLALTVILMTAGISACNSSSGATSEARMHIEIVCLRLPSGEVGCDAAARGAVFGRFASNESLLPGAELRVVLAGTKSGDWRTLATCRVPDQWGSSVMAAKAEFVDRCRNSVVREIENELVDEQKVPEGAAFLGPVTHTFVLRGSRAEQSVPSAEDEVPYHVGFICDTAAGCTRKEVTLGFARWLDEARSVVGSSFRLFVPADNGQRKAMWAFVVPDESHGVQLAAVSAAQYDLSSLTLPVGGNDLASAILTSEESLAENLSKRGITVVETKRQFHVEVVCAEGASGDSACSHDARRRLLHGWAYTAIHAPGSSFELWTPGDKRDTGRRFLYAQIPETWGPGGAEGYLDKVRSLLTTTGGELLGPQTLVAPPRNTEQLGHEKLLVISGAGNVEEPDSQPGFAQRHVSVICDLSNSTLSGACTEEKLVSFYDDFVASPPAAGSTFTIWSPDRSRDTTEQLWAVEVPAVPTARLLTVLWGARKELWGLLPETMERGSALAEAISVAVEDLNQKNGARYLVLLSDMRQYTSGQLNFEKRVPSKQRFLRWLERRKLLVDADGIRLRVSGMHHKRGPNAPAFSAEDARALQQTWGAALAAMKFSWDPGMALCRPTSGKGGRKEVCHVQW